MKIKKEIGNGKEMTKKPASEKVTSVQFAEMYRGRFVPAVFKYWKISPSSKKGEYRPILFGRRKGKGRKRKRK